MALKRLFPASSSFKTIRSIVGGSHARRSFALAVRFHENGDPQKVFKLEELDPNFVKAPLEANEVGLKFIYAPINPSDIFIAQGTYGIRPKLPAIAGNEGVAVVQSTGRDVRDLKAGDLVLPLVGAVGTWSQYQKMKADDVLRIGHYPTIQAWTKKNMETHLITKKEHDEVFSARREVNDDEIFEELDKLNEHIDTLPDGPHFFPKTADIVDPIYASIVAINPSTAYRLLKDFGKLEKGDWIIQNGANSMVGQAVIQFAKEWGFRTINIVRNYGRPDVDTEIRLLTNLGGDINITADYLQEVGFKEILNDLPGGKLPKLGLNCTGGEIATDMARCLAPGGTLVTYGQMSRKPLSVPFDLLTERNLTLRGFWIDEWYRNHSKEERKAMYLDILEMAYYEKYRTFLQLVDLDDFEWGLKQSQEPFKLRKIVLNLDYPDRFKEHDAKPEDDYWIFDTTAR